MEIFQIDLTTFTVYVLRSLRAKTCPFINSINLMISQYKKPTIKMFLSYEKYLMLGLHYLLLILVILFSIL